LVRGAGLDARTTQSPALKDIFELSDVERLAWILTEV
jgi:hypothetical protein